jgi:hypothetical protein
MTSMDKEYPIQLAASVPAQSSRALAVTGILFLKWLLVLPHLIILYFVGIAAFFVGWIAYWVIAFTGRMPEGIHGFLTGYLRWYSRAWGWLFSLTDQYPPFTLGGGSLGGRSGAVGAALAPPPPPPAPSGEAG